MRSWAMLAFSAILLGVAACATGTDGLDLSGGGDPIDAAGTPETGHPRDAATSNPPPPPPPGQDASTPDMDSSVPDMDSSIPPDDSSPPPPVDANMPPAAFCSTSNSTQNAIYGAEYAAALTGSPVFCDTTTGSGCTATQCCFIPQFGLPACVTK